MHVQSQEGAILKDLTQSVSTIWKKSRQIEKVWEHFRNPEFHDGGENFQQIYWIIELACLLVITIKVTKVNISCTCWSSLMQ